VSHSDRFKAFEASVINPPRTREQHESFDVWSLNELEGDERRLAEQILIDRLERLDGDRRPIDALAFIASRSERAMKALEDIVPKAIAAGRFGVALDALRALVDHKRAKKADVVKVATRALNEGDFTQQVTAGQLLAALAPRQAPAAILKVLASSPLGFARGQLFESLMTALDQPPPFEPPGTLARLSVLVAGHTNAARDQALAELGPILEQLAAGHKGRRAGLSEGGKKKACRAAIDALLEERAPTRAELDAMDEDGRAYVGAWCRARLPSQTAAHYDTLAALGDAMSLPIVEDALGWDDDMLHGARPHLEKLRRDLSH
jgi:hypothetical protein